MKSLLVIKPWLAYQMYKYFWHTSSFIEEYL